MMLSKAWLLAVILAVVPSSAGHANYINTASVFELPTSVRAVGMGGAFIAVADDEAAVRYNPAGLTQLTSPSFSSSFTRPFGVYSFGALSVAERGWGAKLVLLDSGKLVERDLYGNPTGTFRHVETGLVLAGGTGLGGGLSIGLQGQLYARVLPRRGTGASLSPALSFQEGGRTYALVWRNALSTDLSFASGHTEPWTRNLALGFSWSFGPTRIAVDFTERLVTRGDVSSVRVGVEHTQFSPVILRAGTYREGSSFGASVYWRSFRMDVAYVLHYALPDSYHAALVYSWEEPLRTVMERPFRWLLELFR